MKNQPAVTLDHDPRLAEHEASTTAEPGDTTPDADDDFHLTIRKLETPIRPRGVLAE